MSGGFVLPERIDQPVAGHDLVRIEQQHGEQGTLLRAAEVERLPVGDHLQRAEDPELHPPPGPGGSPCFRDVNRSGAATKRSVTRPLPIVRRPVSSRSKGSQEVAQEQEAKMRHYNPLTPLRETGSSRRSRGRRDGFGGRAIPVWIPRTTVRPPRHVRLAPTRRPGRGDGAARCAAAAGPEGRTACGGRESHRSTGRSRPRPTSSSAMRRRTPAAAVSVPQSVARGPRTSATRRWPADPRRDRPSRGVRLERLGDRDRHRDRAWRCSSEPPS